MSNWGSIIDAEDTNLGCGNHAAPVGHPQSDICFPREEGPWFSGEKSWAGPGGL